MTRDQRMLDDDERVRRASPLAYFLLVFALSIPFALLGATRIQLFPGIPISALGFVCPALAAIILSYRAHGTEAVQSLLKRSLEFKRSFPPFWLAPIFLLVPVMALLTRVVMRATGSPSPAPQFAFPASLILLALFLIAALGEEIGWSGYAIDPLQARWSALAAALLLGVVWAVWHIIAMVQAGQSWPWIAWGCLDMVGTRVLMVWIYNNTGRSVLAVVAYHAIANLTLKSMFPGGSYEAERILSVIIALVAIVVTIVWGPATLTRSRRSESPA